MAPWLDGDAAVGTHAGDDVRHLAGDTRLAANSGLSGVSRNVSSVWARMRQDTNIVEPRVIADRYGRGVTLRSSNPTTVAGARLPNGRWLRLFVTGAMIVTLVAGGCSHVDEKHQAGILTREANAFFNQGNYAAALQRYAQIIADHPVAADRALFEMGITYAYPRNADKDYQQALDCFETLLGKYPDSEFRHDSQMMIMQIHQVIRKDRVIADQQAELDTARQALDATRQALAGKADELTRKSDEIATLQATVAALKDKVFALWTDPVDKVLIEKQARRLTLLSEGEVLKTYKIALGGDPVGPKEREGDNKTPEGIYIIDARNDNSDFHLALHISYPNERDRYRARQRGVSPGGDIMIHGIKNGFSQIGASHAERDWTEGCIAVTNQEMEEIYRRVANGTVVEIVP